MPEDRTQRRPQVGGGRGALLLVAAHAPYVPRSAFTWSTHFACGPLVLPCSGWASGASIYNRVLAERPDLLEVRMGRARASLAARLHAELWLPQCAGMQACLVCIWGRHMRRRLALGGNASAA